MAEPLVATSVFDRLLKDRIIWLGSEVRDDNANEICAKILLLAAEDPEKDIFLYVNSPGGSITAGMAIYDTMQFVPNDIVTVGHRHGRLDGTAAADQRHEGQALHHAERPRAAAPAARRLRRHRRATSRRRRSSSLDMKNRLAEITAAQTGKSVEQINEDGDRDRWFTAQEALEYGFVDHIRAPPRRCRRRRRNRPGLTEGE